MCSQPEPRILRDYQTWTAAARVFQLCGSNSSIRLIGCVATRESTSRNQANGSTAFRLHIAIKLSRTAAVLPPLSLPKNVQLPRPIAMPRLARSVAPFVDLQIAVLHKPRQRLPLVQRVAHRRVVSAPDGLFGRTSSRISSRYWCSLSITGADSRLRNASLSSPASPLARSSTEY